MVGRMDKKLSPINRKRSVLVLSCLLFGLLLALSCGKNETRTETDQYEGWTKYSYGHFIMNFSPTSRYSAKKASVAKGFERFLTEICEMLEMPVPEDKIYLYVYSGGGEAKTITGRDVPFSNDTAIHWAGLRPYGYQLTKFLLAQKGVPQSKYHVLNEGIANLLDFSGINYHDRANRSVNSNKFVRLIELGDNDVFDTMGGYIQRSESASLAAFIMFGYGPDRLFMLSASLADWKESIETLFQMEIDQFEESWLQFALEHSLDSLGTMENDSTYKVRIEVNGQ